MAEIRRRKPLHPLRSVRPPPREGLTHDEADFLIGLGEFQRELEANDLEIRQYPDRHVPPEEIRRTRIGALKNELEQLGQLQQSLASIAAPNSGGAHRQSLLGQPNGTQAKTSIEDLTTATTDALANLSPLFLQFLAWQRLMQINQQVADTQWAVAANEEGLAEDLENAARNRLRSINASDRNSPSRMDTNDSSARDPSLFGSNSLPSVNSAGLSVAKLGTRGSSTNTSTSTSVNIASTSAQPESMNNYFLEKSNMTSSVPPVPSVRMSTRMKRTKTNEKKDEDSDGSPPRKKKRASRDSTKEDRTRSKDEERRKEDARRREEEEKRKEDERKREEKRKEEARRREDKKAAELKRKTDKRLAEAKRREDKKRREEAERKKLEEAEQEEEQQGEKDDKGDKDEKMPTKDSEEANLNKNNNETNYTKGEGELKKPPEDDLMSDKSEFDDNKTEKTTKEKDEEKAGESEGPTSPRDDKSGKSSHRASEEAPPSLPLKEDSKKSKRDSKGSNNKSQPPLINISDITGGTTGNKINWVGAKHLITIGRGSQKPAVAGQPAPAPLPVPDINLACFDSIKTISRQHATIEWRDGSFYVKNLSRNGTKLNSRPIGPIPVKLISGNKLEISKVKLVVTFGDN